MEQARYTGVDKSKRPFFVTAEEAAEQADPQIADYRASQPKADILMEDGSWIAVTAELGNYNPGNAISRTRGNRKFVSR